VDSITTALLGADNLPITRALSRVDAHIMAEGVMAQLFEAQDQFLDSEYLAARLQDLQDEIDALDVERETIRHWLLNQHPEIYEQWNLHWEQRKEETMANAPDTAITRLKQAVEQANAPLIQALAKVTSSVDRLVVVVGAQLKQADTIDQLREQAKDLVDEVAEEQEPDAPIADDFDMESAIKASGQWECGPIHCGDCPIEQNMDCLATYGLQDTAEAAAGNADTDDAFRSALHRVLRSVVPVAALTARRKTKPATATFVVPEPPKPKIKVTNGAGNEPEKPKRADKSKPAKKPAAKPAKGGKTNKRKGKK